MDESKAFDSCDHEIVIKKIKQTGINARGVRLLESYLIDRKQKIAVNGVEGGIFAINIGVGQGTVLGPTLFKIYIMDLHLSTNLFCMKFADYSTFEGTGKTRDEAENFINMELIKVADWFRKNRLCYGLQEESVKLLGIQIDENLDWGVHIKSVQKNIKR